MPWSEESQYGIRNGTRRFHRTCLASPKFSSPLGIPRDANSAFGNKEVVRFNIEASVSAVDTISIYIATNDDIKKMDL